MATGKAVNLRVRPVQSVDLCFPVDGVIGNLSNSLLGKAVIAYDLDTLYGTLSTVSGDPSQLVWTAIEIKDELTGHLLASLRAEPIKADLDNAIGMRQNAYITSYSESIIEEYKKVFNSNNSDPDSVLLNLVTDLEFSAKALHNSLNTHYNLDGLTGSPIKTTKSDTTYGSVSKNPLGYDIQENTATSSTTTRGYEYRIPSMENDARYRRTRIGLRQEHLSAWRMYKMCEQANITFRNELAAIDRQIKKLQVSYIDTMLVAPFSGTVTGIFRNVGDFVSAGQPVLRVENYDEVYLVGAIKHRGIVRVGNKVIVKTTLFDAPGGQQTQVIGFVSSVRGHDAVDEQWDVLVRCNNIAAGTHILPVNYNFDFESTTIEVTTA